MPRRYADPADGAVSPSSESRGSMAAGSDQVNGTAPSYQKKAVPVTPTDFSRLSNLEQQINGFSYMEQRMKGLEELVSRCVSDNENLKASLEKLHARMMMDKDNMLDPADFPDDPKLHAGQTAGGKVAKVESLEGGGANNQGPTTSWNLARCQESDEVGVDTWNFRQSCWDACAFLGDSNIMMCGESMVIVAMLLINVFMQIGFIIIVAFSLSGTSLDEDTIDGYHWWRTNVGHSVTFTDLMSEKSLASRVCAGDTSLHLSDTQTQQVKEIEAYLYENSPFNGPLMCSLALLTWVLTVSKELHALKQMVRALTIIERGATQIIIDRTHFPAGLKLTRLSAARLYWILFLCIPRAGIACSLLVFGAKYLAVTISIEDILLNAVALEFVMNVDELLYAALAPIKTRSFTIKMKPLPLGKSPACSGVDRNVLIAAVAVFGFFGAALPLWLVPEFDLMRKVKHELCGGLLEWSYTYSSGGFVSWAKEQQAEGEALKALEASTRYRIIRNTIDEIPFEATEAARLEQLRGPGWSVFSVDAWRIDEIGKQINPFCLDLLNSTVMLHVLNASAHRDQFAVMAEAALRDSLGDQSISSCDNVTHACGLYNHIGATARSLCSLSCGCAVPRSGLLLPWSPEGCPSSCMAEQYQLQVDMAPCVDTPSNTSIFQGLVTSLRLIPGMEALVVYYESMGCGGAFAVDSGFGTNFCHMEASFKAMALICPVSCMCKQKPGAFGCPKTC